MISSATSANATTSARRITGGVSDLLSGRGTPSWATTGCRSLAATFVRSPGDGLLDGGLGGTGLPGATLTIVLPPRETAMTGRDGVARGLNSGCTTSGCHESSVAEV